MDIGLSIPEKATSSRILKARGTRNGSIRITPELTPDAVRGPVLRIGLNGNLMYANEQGRAMLDSLGWRRHMRLPTPLPETLAAIRSQGDPVPLELACGEEVYLLVASVSYGGYVDITGARILAGAVLAEALPQLVCGCDSSGQVIYANKPWLEYTGLSVSQPNRPSWQAPILPHDLSHLNRLWAKALREHTQLKAEFRYRRRDGVYRWFLACALPITDSYGNIVKWMISATDIHDSKLSESKLQHANDRLNSCKHKIEKTVAQRTLKLQQSLSEAQAFAHHVAHDLHGPLLSIRAFTKSTLEECGSLLGSRAEDLKVVLSAAQRMTAFISDLLQYGKLAHQEPSLQPIDVVELIQELIRERPDFKAPHARIEIETPVINVLGDLVSLAQSLTNLLGNAVKFVAPNTVPQIRIFAREARHGRIRIFFQDNGIGIPEKHLKSIFDPFHRAASGDYAGHGLGLAIVHRAVTRMHGRAGVESTLGQGSCFWIELPRVDLGESNLTNNSHPQPFLSNGSLPQQQPVS